MARFQTVPARDAPAHLVPSARCREHDTAAVQHRPHLAEAQPLEQRA